jgi:hypothetical protein
VLGRASRLDEATRRLVELVSMVPSRIGTPVPDTVMPDWTMAAEEPEVVSIASATFAFSHSSNFSVTHSVSPVTDGLSARGDGRA